MLGVEPTMAMAAPAGRRRRGGGCCGSASLSSVLVGVYVVLATLLVGCVTAFMRMFSPFGFRYLKVPGPPALPYMGLNTNPVFAWHPVLFTAAYAALMGSATLAFQAGLGGRKAPSPANRLLRKRLHAFLHAASGIFIGLGLAAVITSQKAAGRPLFYTGHSWVGMASCGLYALNFALGFSSFLLPCAPGALRMRVLPLHNFLGWLCFGTGLQAIASGIEEIRVLTLTVYLPAGAIPKNFTAPILLLMPLAQILLSALIATALAHAMLVASTRREALVAAADATAKAAVDYYSGTGGGGGGGGFDGGNNGGYGGHNGGGADGHATYNGASAPNEGGYYPPGGAPPPLPPPVSARVGQHITAV